MCCLRVWNIIAKQLKLMGVKGAKPLKLHTDHNINLI